MLIKRIFGLEPVSQSELNNGSQMVQNIAQVANLRPMSSEVTTNDLWKNYVTCTKSIINNM